MRLFVVAGSPPEISFVCSPCRSMAAHPPGPGFPWHPPSVKMVIFFKPDNHSNLPGIRQPDSL
jgi:hypothetical protein